MKKFTQALMTIALVAGITTAALAPSQPAFAACKDAVECMTSGANKAGGATNNTVPDLLRIITNVLLFLLGGIAVIMIVVGGIKYVTSNGDSAAMTSAKNTIMYSVFGLIIAIAAYAIVSFVIEQFT